MIIYKDFLLTRGIHESKIFETRHDTSHRRIREFETIQKIRKIKRATNRTLDRTQNFSLIRFLF